jgi:hypothetical protein
LESFVPTLAYIHFALWLLQDWLHRKNRREDRIVWEKGTASLKIQEAAKELLWEVFYC